MLATLVWTMLVAGPPAAKLPTATAREMTEALAAVNKALGLESWTGVPCVDRGGLEATIKDISVEDTRRCASTALADGFSGLGKDYAVGITMADIGPVTDFAIGLDDADGWGAYSCDPTRKCTPTKLDAASKQAKRLLERYRKACADPRTVWFPSRDQVCSDIPMAASAGSKPAAAAPAVRPSQTIQTKLPVGKRVDEPATDTSGP